MKKLTLCLTITLLVWYQCLFAADLIEVYCEAVKCDATLNSKMAELMANRENIPINRSLLLPRLNIQGKAERQRVKLDGISFASFRNGVFIPESTSVTFYSNHVDYTLKLSQPIFNYTNWAKLQQAKSSVKQAEASFCASAQDLMVRVVRAYFDILIANANLFYTREHKKAVAEELRQIREQFKVGTVPITNVYEAKANYDTVVAQEISDRYDLAKKIEALRAITTHLYCNIKGLGEFLPLITPCPADINAWVCRAEKQNFQLLAARYGALAARDNIKIQAGDALPAINGYGRYEYDFDSNFQGSDVLNREKILAGGVEVTWAPIQGGGILSRTHQAQFKFQQACFDQEVTHRQIVTNARNAYLGIFAGIAKVRADRESIRSAQESVRVTTESYRVGTRTILDVLNEQAKLYNVLKSFSQDRYEYIYQTVLLKQAAGTISVEDLQHINCWLYSCIDIAEYDALLQGCIPP